jgi:hypothetical protein
MMNACHESPRGDSRCRLLTHRGVTRSMTDWSRTLGIAFGTLRHRIQIMPLEDALEGLPPRIVTDARYKELWQGANTVRYEDDPQAQRVVAEFGPLTRKTVGFILGLSGERARQVEETALRKLRERMRGGDVQA